MDDSINRVARAAGVPESHLRRELASAIRRSEPDAREVYGVINGRRFVARRAASTRAIRRSEPDAREVYGVIGGRRFVARRAAGQPEWTVSLEARPQPWERRGTDRSSG
jgi:hypothetical protein